MDCYGQAWMAGTPARVAHSGLMFRLHGGLYAYDGYAVASGSLACLYAWQVRPMTRTA